MRIPCWRITFKGTVTLPVSGGSRYAQMIQTRHPKGTNAGVVTEGVTLAWCGHHVEIDGANGEFAIIPAGDVSQADSTRAMVAEALEALEAKLPSPSPAGTGAALPPVRNAMAPPPLHVPDIG